MTFSEFIPKGPIDIPLQGGLGNQLFQITSGLNILDGHDKPYTMTSAGSPENHGGATNTSTRLYLKH
jgi:hypothetical protein